MDDPQIVELFWQRSERAIPEAERKYGSYCRSIAARLLRSPEDAEECLNDTWLRAWNSMPENRPERLGPYLGRLTRWLCLDRLRGEGRQKRGGQETLLVYEELEEVLAGSQVPERELEQKELAAAIGRFLAALAAGERTMFLARYWYGLPLSEIAERLGCSLGKVKTMLYRTRKKLQRQLREEDYL